MSALAVHQLSLGRAGSPHAIVDDVTLGVEAGEVLGLVGESATGKTTLGRAALGYLGGGMELRGGEVRVGGVSLVISDHHRSSDPRARRVGFVSQHPASALNPAFRVGKILASMLESTRPVGSGSNPDDRIGEVLRAVSLPDSPDFVRKYPHQLSGGQMQRVAMAVALVCRPEVVVLDEPTSGLDTVTSSRVLTTIRTLSREHGLAVVCISHDLAVIAEVADRLCVLYAGHVVEEGPVREVLAAPAHPYTHHLVAAVAASDGGGAVGLPGRAPPPAQRGIGCRFASRCELARDECRRALPPLIEVGADRRARCIDPFALPVRLRPRAGPPRRRPDQGVALTLRDVSAAHHGNDVVHSVSLDVERAEWLAIVGESGSGKTTLIRTIAGTHPERRGAIELAGASLAASVRDRTPSQRSAIQSIPQHPYESFNPRRTIGHSVARPLRLRGAGRVEARRAVDEVLGRVAVDAAVGDRYPAELSGGELQRAAIARALVAEPTVLLADEITASLDSVIEATIVELLHRLHIELGLTIVFVTHDLALVQSVSDRTAVIADGRLVEIGRTADVFRNPSHTATRTLLAHRRTLPA